MYLDGLGKVHDRTSEGQTVGVYGSLARVGARDGTRELRIKVNSDKELTESGWMEEGDSGEAE